MTLTRAERNQRYAERVRRGLVQPRDRAPQPAKPSAAAEQLARLVADVPMPRELRVSAPCRGKWDTFDPAGEKEHRLAVAERHAEAVEFCDSCRLLEVCRGWLDSLPPAQRPIGVVAGRVVHPHHRRKETP